MVVLGKHSYVFDKVPFRTCDVLPFDPKLGVAKRVPIIDGAIAYDCPFTLKTFVLMFRNALHVPDLEHNLIPPFILREAGIKVNEAAKIHCPNPTVNDHAIIVDDHNLTIPLQLNGTFSYFHTRTPTLEDLEEGTVILFSPDTSEWDPYSHNFEAREESMTDWNGEIMNQKYKKSRRESRYDWDIYEKDIDKVIASSVIGCHPNEPLIEVSQSIAQLECNSYASMLNDKVIDAKMCQSLGAMTPNKDYDDDLFTYQTDGGLYETVFNGRKLTNDSVIVCTAIAKPPDKIDKNHLAKIWCIKESEAQKVLDQSTILLRKGKSNSLSRRYPTNDRMLRYRRLQSKFFTDTFFATKNAVTLRGFNSAQLFVSDKGYMGIYFMKRKGEFKQALHQFCKEVGVPATLVCDPSGEQTSNDVKSFCHQVGTTLRVLEESTQWANRAETYIGILKESIRQDMRRSDAPLCLWDYCAERRCKIHNVIPKDLFQLQGSNPTTVTFGTQPDISDICQFQWYDWCYYREESIMSSSHIKRSNLGKSLVLPGMRVTQ